LTDKDSSSAIAHIILEALQQGDKNRGELFDLTGKSYPVLIQVLQQLKDKNLIEIYFAPTMDISVLTYRLHSKST
jgi:DNA-binding HxlR family transcriptional regulator